ncbi:MAG TPA: flavin reductase [Baekduia sp.]|uniref:flavin reductase n=1 Tax=Baekduia sp. TaxID=2600305 RepID=UPI002D77F244|nr:flavin reductase [Baekduia sp.]HET6509066.1 flavin reductase [Baekduia sp.]
MSDGIAPAPGVLASRESLHESVAHDALVHLGRTDAAVTVAFGGTLIGRLARTVSTISHDPPRLLVALDGEGRTAEGLDAVGAFAVNLLDGPADAMTRRFAGNGDVGLEWFSVARGSSSGTPLLREAAAQLECVVQDACTVGDVRVYVAGVVDVRARTGASLRALDDGLRSLVASRDDETYHALRKLVLAREIPLDNELLVEDVVEHLGVERANVTYALARLTHEGLVTRQSSERYLITPVDEHLLVTLLHARRTLLMGVTDALIDELTDEEIATVVEAAEATRRPKGTTDFGLENDRSAQIFRAFNEVIVGLSGNSVLLDEYRRLSVPTVMGRILWRMDWSTLHDRLSEHAIEFATALAARDRADAIRAIRAFNDSVHKYAVGVLEATGGRL